MLIHHFFVYNQPKMSIEIKFSYLLYWIAIKNLTKLFFSYYPKTSGGLFAETKIFRNVEVYRKVSDES